MSATTLAASSRLESLPERPPTPPRETNHDPDAHLKATLSSDHLEPGKPTNLHTPPGLGLHSPSGATSSHRSKKVEFSAQAEYKDPPAYLADDNARQQPTPVSIPQRPAASSGPVKSILKVTYGPAPNQNPLDPTNGTSPDAANLATMLESTIQQLAGTDRDLKVDAYMMLARALKTSNNLPDRIALQGKMSLFTQFIQRDITSKSSAGAMDLPLVNHAFVLLVTFLHFHAIASSLPTDFGIFIVEHSIRTLSDPAVPKDMARHLMQVLAIQNFSLLKVMTSPRVGKLVAVLHNLPSHVRDKKGIYNLRIIIYKRLVRQCKHHMIQHSDWLPDLFEGMLSSIWDIRTSAIALGKEAAFTLVQEKLMSKKVIELLQQPSPLEEEEGEEEEEEEKEKEGKQGRTYVEHYTKVLERMAKDKDAQNSRHVPQIWSIVFLFLRSPDKWNFFASWLVIIQLCFNSPDFQTKQEAHFAWSRLVYTLNRDQRSFPPRLIPTLAQPLVSQLNKRRVGGKPDDFRKVVLGTAYTIFYYAFKPQATPVQLELWWDNCLRPFIQQLADQRPHESKESCEQASAILTSLFDCSTPRIWKVDRVADNAPIKSDELPAIEPKWLRRNPARVFAVVEPILRASFHELGNTRSMAHKLWRTLISAVAHAASKEIKVSDETAGFLGHSLGLIRRFWGEGAALVSEDVDGGGAARFLASMRELILVMIETPLGHLPFTQKHLAMDKEEKNFVPVATPSHRSGKHQADSRPPLHHLFSILSTLPTGVPDNHEFTDFFKSIFNPFLSTRDARSQRNLAQEMLQIIPMASLCPSGPWVLVAETVCAGLESSQNSHKTDTSSGIDSLVGQEYREVVRVLERGLRSTPNFPWQQWQSLFCLLTERVRNEAGDAGVAIVVIEPLAKVLLEQSSQELASPLPNNTVAAFVELLSGSTQPRDRQAIEAARRRLWGTAVSGSRTAFCDTFDSLYRLSNAILSRLYTEFDVHASQGYLVPALKEVSAFICRCNPPLVLQTLSSLQDGLAVWIRDEDTRLNSRQYSTAAEATKSLWDRACALLSEAETSESLPLAKIETLLCAAFESKHRYIVNTVSTMWNVIFEKAGEVAYPDRLKAVLLSRHSFVDMVLPGLDVSSSASRSGGAQQLIFIDSQDDMDVLEISPEKSKSLDKASGKGAIPSNQTRRAEKESPRSAKEWGKGPHGVTKASASKGRKKSSPRSRLRHDDSQIEFAPIESSPCAQPALESQVLTERQREVRDRQKAEAALFPEMRSSPNQILPAAPRADALMGLEQGSSQQKQRAVTPDAEGGFQGFISSTPTPRRGQPPLILGHDNDAADPPSSPPEPRRYPLVPEIETRASSDRLLDEWNFSSSPISASPSPSRPSTADAVEPTKQHAEETVVDETDHDMSQVQDFAPEHPRPAPKEKEAVATAAVADDLAPVAVSPRSQEKEAIMTMVADDAAALSCNKISSKLPKKAQKQAQIQGQPDTAGDLPSTPRRSRRTRMVQETPKSDNDIFVDAPTSLSKSSHKAVGEERVSQVCPTSQDQSFIVSDGIERSMLRLVVELDGKARPPPNLTEPTPSPERHPEQQQQHELDGSEAQECITVKETTRPKKGRGRLKKSKTAATFVSPTVHTTSTSGIETEASSQDTSSSTKQKRKRSLSKADARVSPKKAKHPTVTEPEPEPEPAEALDSQRGSVAPDIPVQSAMDTSEQSVASPAYFGAEDEEMEPDPEAVHQQLEHQIALEHESQQAKIFHRRSVSIHPDSPPEEHVQPSGGAREEDGEEDEMIENEQGLGEIWKEKGKGKAEATTSETVQRTSQSPKPKTKLQAIMEMLKGGLAVLKSSSLSRSEASEVEDLFFDIKHELYAAEKRGRK